jgi:hypothetical protein
MDTSPPPPTQTALLIIVIGALFMTEHNRLTHFLVLIFGGYGSCAASIDTIGLGYFIRNVRDIHLFHACPGAK